MNGGYCTTHGVFVGILCPQCVKESEDRYILSCIKEVEMTEPTKGGGNEDNKGTAARRERETLFRNTRMGMENVGDCR